MSHLTEQPLDATALMAETAGPEHGALALFAGTVRHDNEGKDVVGLSYSAYRPLAERRLAEIETEAEADHPGARCRVVHRLGEVAIGDTSVLVVVRSPHRAEAFAAARQAIEAIKHEVPIFKHERYADGTETYLQGNSLHHGIEDPET